MTLQGRIPDFVERIIDKYYPAGSVLRDIYIAHCRGVASFALILAKRNALPIEESDIMAAAMLHDIGIVKCYAPGIECNGMEPYIRHGVIGAQMLRDESRNSVLSDDARRVLEQCAGVCEHHTGAGISAAEVTEENLPLPVTDYLPVTTLERLICYADKFFSKSESASRMKSFASVVKGMGKFGPESLRRFEALVSEFGEP